MLELFYIVNSDSQLTNSHDCITQNPRKSLDKSKMILSTIGESEDFKNEISYNLAEIIEITRGSEWTEIIE